MRFLVSLVSNPVLASIWEPEAVKSGFTAEPDNSPRVAGRWQRRFWRVHAAFAFTSFLVSIGACGEGCPDATEFENRAAYFAIFARLAPPIASEKGPRAFTLRYVSTDKAD